MLCFSWFYHEDKVNLVVLRAKNMIDQLKLVGLKKKNYVEELLAK
jgi:hypothetical protein